MSDFTGLTVISFLGAIGFFLSLYFGKLANDLGAQIATGVIGGTPISSDVRRVMLFHMWVPYETAGMALSVFMAMAQLRLADSVGDADIRLLAYFVAFIAAVGSVNWLVSGTVCFIQYRGLLNPSKPE